MAPPEFLARESEDALIVPPSGCDSEVVGLVNSLPLWCFVTVMPEAGGAP